MDYERLCAYYDRLEATTKRLEMTDILVELLHEAGGDIRPVVYLTRGQLAADFVGLELGVADKLAIRAIAFASGVDEAEVTKSYHSSGDLGDAAHDLLSKKRPRRRQTTLFGDAEEEAAAKATTVSEVFSRFIDIANASGAGSQDRKLSGLQSLLMGASPNAARYIVRTTTGKLRLGIADMTFLDAMALAFATKEHRPDIERAYNVSSDIGLVAQTLLEKGIAGLEELRLTVGVPVRAMLAERLPTPEEILEKLGGEALVELKYDGLRLQAHIPRSGPVRFYSRRLEDLTPQFPDVAESLRAAFHGKEAIVEGEVVAVDESGEMRPFQDTALRRGRKKDLEKLIDEMPVTYFLFDALLLDGEDLTMRPLPERRAALTAAFGVSDRVQFTRAETVTQVAQLNAFFEASVVMGAEGIMVKSIRGDSAYQPGSRGYHWIKYKREYSAELTDSLDLVCVGALVGRGRRAGLYGAFLMAAYNPEEDVFETVCKMGTGLDDAQLLQAKEMLEPTRHAGGSPHPRVRANMPMDVWFAPSKVAEVVGAELTLSPIHTSAWGALKEGAGLALRFPRFVGWRDDKEPEAATSLDELIAMFKQQGQRRKGAAEDEG